MLDQIAINRWTTIRKLGTKTGTTRKKTKNKNTRKTSRINATAIHPARHRYSKAVRVIYPC
jgi:hypothetical protein